MFRKIASIKDLRHIKSQISLTRLTAHLRVLNSAENNSAFKWDPWGRTFEFSPTLNPNRCPRGLWIHHIIWTSFNCKTTVRIFVKLSFKLIISNFHRLKPKDFPPHALVLDGISASIPSLQLAVILALSDADRVSWPRSLEEEFALRRPNHDLFGAISYEESSKRSSLNGGYVQPPIWVPIPAIHSSDG